VITFNVLELLTRGKQWATPTLFAVSSQINAQLLHGDNPINEGDARTLWAVMAWLTSKYVTRNYGSNCNLLSHFRFTLVLYWNLLQKC
jgi:hypothetical protein